MIRSKKDFRGIAHGLLLTTNNENQAQIHRLTDLLISQSVLIFTGDRTMKFQIITFLLAFLLTIGGAFRAGANPPSWAAVQVQQITIQELVESAGTIVSGRVVEIREGRHPDYPNVPVTYVTLEVEDVFKDDGAKVRRSSGHRLVTFMQFGGLRALRVHDVPGYREGEEIVLFLYPESQYGFTSPVGGLQGKFAVQLDHRTGRRMVVNGLDNSNLFRGLDAEQMQLSSTEKKIARTERGSVDYDAFASLVRKLVKAQQ